MVFCCCWFWFWWGGFLFVFIFFFVRLHMGIFNFKVRFCHSLSYCQRLVCPSCFFKDFPPKLLCVADCTVHHMDPVCCFHSPLMTNHHFEKSFQTLLLPDVIPRGWELTKSFNFSVIQTVPVLTGKGTLMPRKFTLLVVGFRSECKVGVVTSFQEKYICWYLPCLYTRKTLNTNYVTWRLLLYLQRIFFFQFSKHIVPGIFDLTWVVTLLW